MNLVHTTQVAQILPNSVTAGKDLVVLLALNVQMDTADFQTANQTLASVVQRHVSVIGAESEDCWDSKSQHVI